MSFPRAFGDINLSFRRRLHQPVPDPTGRLQPIAMKRLLLDCRMSASAANADSIGIAVFPGHSRDAVVLPKQHAMWRCILPKI